VEVYDQLRDLVLDEPNTYELLTVFEVGEMIDKLKGKRHSRIWFDPDVRLLDALHTAEQALEKVCSFLAVEGRELPDGR
jgi:hypothetical protein